MRTRNCGSKRVIKDGSAEPEALIAPDDWGGGWVRSIAVDGDTFYWVDVEKIHYRPKAGGVVMGQIAVGLNTVVAVDAGAVYFADVSLQ